MRRYSILAVVAVAGAFAWKALALADGPATERTIEVDGRQRKYLVFAPSGAAGKLPVVLAFHGGTGSARQFERFSKLNLLADREGFLVVYPDGIGGNWNDGRVTDVVQAIREGVDDVKFTRAMVDDIEKNYSIDRSRIYSTGISNGAFFSNRLAAEASDLVAAVAPVVGSMTPEIGANFNPKFPVSVLIIQGEADPLVLMAGGEIGIGRKKRGKAMAASDVLALYLRRNGNANTPASSTLDADPSDGTTVEVSKYPDGPDGAKTHYYLVKNGGHTWPGSPFNLPEMIVGKASRDFSANETIWEFFKSCPPRTIKN